MSDESLGTSTAGELEAVSGSTSPGVSLTSPTELPHAKNKKVEKGSEVDEVILGSMRDLHERCSRRGVADEHKLFGQHIAAVLRGFNRRQQAHARLRIEQVLIDVEFPEDSVMCPGAYSNTY